MPEPVHTKGRLGRWLLIAGLLSTIPAGSHVSAQQGGAEPAAPEVEAPAPSEPAGETVEAESPSEPSLQPAGEAARMAARPVDASTGITFTPGTGLSVTSADGEFGLVLDLRAQLVYSLRTSGVDGTSENELAHDLRIRRARVTFLSHFLGEENRLAIQLALSPNDLGIQDHLPSDDVEASASPLLDLYFDFRHHRDIELRVGQYKVPYSRQREISSFHLHMVDRSIAQAEFNLDRDIGFDLRSRDLAGLERLRYYAGIYAGRGRDARGFEDFDEFGLTYLGRLEVLPLGFFADYDEVDFERSREARLSLGIAYAFQNEASGLRQVLASTPDDCATLDPADPDACAVDATTPGTVDYHDVTADLMFKMLGFTLQSEFFWRRGSRDPGQDDTGADAQWVEPARTGVSWFVQTGYLIPHLPIGVSARYSIIRGIGTLQNLAPVDDQGGVTSLDDENALGVGLTWFIARHALKVNTDYFHYWGADVRDVLGDHVVRLQLQGAL